MNDLKETVSSTYLHDISRLFSDYLRLFPDEADSLSLLHQQLQSNDSFICSRSNMTGHLTASTLLVNTKDQTVLLIYHKFLRLWLQPGGHMDINEEPSVGALRELREETGIDNATIHPWHASSGIPIDIDTHRIPSNDKKNEGEHFHHDMQYVCLSAIERPDSLVLDASEVTRNRWVSLDELKSGVSDGRLRRVAEKLDAMVRDGVLVLCESR